MASSRSNANSIALSLVLLIGTVACVGTAIFLMRTLPGHLYQGLPTTAPGTGTPLPASPLPQTTTIPLETPIPALESTLPPPPTNEPQPTLTYTPTFPPPTATLPSLETSWVEQTLANMSLKQKIGQMIMTGINGSDISPATCNFIQRVKPGAIVYIGGNVHDPWQTQTLSSALQTCAEEVGIPPLFIAMDHEGQYVYRFNRGATIFPPPMAQAALDAPQMIYEIAFAAGQELAFSGINMILGPDADVLTNFDNTAISTRSYGGDPNQVARFVTNAFIGYRDAGLIPVLKHFPGHGNVQVDSHNALPIDTADRPFIQSQLLPPFQSGIDEGVPVIMLNHVAYPAFDPAINPATFSPPIFQLLRNEMNFNGIALSDALNMGAIKNSRGLSGAEASILAVQAGMDMVLIVSADEVETVSQQLFAAVERGDISRERINEAVRRILAVKLAWGLSDYTFPPPPQPSWEQNQALANLVGYQAVTLLKDEIGYPTLLNSASNVLVIGPPDAWGIYNPFANLLSQKGIATNFQLFSAPWNGVVPDPGSLQTLPSLAEGYDFTIVFTWEAHINRINLGDTFQASLVNRLLQTNRPVVVVALKSPTDILEFPEAPVFFATYGTTNGQVAGIIDALAGNMQPEGVSPLPDLP